MAGTLATLRAHLAAVAEGARAVYVAEVTAYDRSASATATRRFATAGHDAMGLVAADVPELDSARLVIGSRSLAIGGRGSILDALFAEFTYDLADLALVPGPAVEGGLRHGAPTWKAAVAAGAYSGTLEGLTPGAKLEAGEAFRPATATRTRWHVILTAVEADTNGEAAVTFYPAADATWSLGDAVVAAETISDAVRWSPDLYEGRAASVYVVGREAPVAGAPGLVVPWSGKGTILSGGLVHQATLSQQKGLALQLRPPGDKLGKEFAAERPGFGVCPLFNAGAYYRTATAAGWDIPDGAGDLDLQATAFLSLDTVGDTVGRYIITNGDHTTSADGGWGLWYDPTPRKVKVFVILGSVGSGTRYDAETDALDLEWWYTFRATWDASENSLLIRWMKWDRDRDISSSSATTTSGSYSAPGNDFLVGSRSGSGGAPSPATTTRWVGLIAQIGIFDTVSTTYEEQMRRRLTDTETDLVVVWTDDLSLSGVGAPYKWFGHGPSFDVTATPTSAYELQEQTTTDPRSHSLWGGLEMAGTRPPAPLGKAYQVPGDAVAGGEYFIYQFSHRMGGPFLPGASETLAVYDGGVEQVLDTAFLSLVTFLATAPTAAQYNTYHGPHGHFARLDGAPSSAVTADIFGCSLWDYAAELDGTSAYATVPAAGISTVMGDESTFMSWIYASRDTEVETWFDNFETGGGFKLEYYDTSPRRLLLTLGYDNAGATSDSVQLLATTNPQLSENRWGGRPHHVAVVLSEPTGTQVKAEVYINAVSIGSMTKTGQIAASSQNFRIGASLTPDQYAAGLVGEPQVYDWALTQAEILDRMVSVDPMTEFDAADRPEHYYPAPTDPKTSSWTTWLDAGQTGSQDATLTNVKLGPPVPVAWIVEAAKCVWQAAGLTTAQYDLTGLLTVRDDVLGAAFAGNTPLSDILSRFAWSAPGWFRWDGPNGAYSFVKLADWTAGAADEEVYEENLVDGVDEGRVLAPPFTVGMGYQPTGLKQDSVLDGADVPLDFINRLIRYATADIANARTEHPAGDELVEIDGMWASEAAARSIAEEIAVVLALAPREVDFADHSELGTLLPGQTVDLHAVEVEGGKSRVLVLAIDVEGRVRRIQGLGVPVG